MNVLITYFSQTNNTARIAQAIYEEILTLGHIVSLNIITEVSANDLDACDLVFVGSTCHDTDLAKPVKRFLEQIGKSPRFKLAGFVTHATQMPEDSKRASVLYEKWAGNCIRTFHQISFEKQITFLGYFHCQGMPSPPIEAFIHNTILTDGNDWATYIADVQGHPDQDDMQKAKKFARQVIDKSGVNLP